MKPLIEKILKEYVQTKSLLIEKRIGQISANMKVSFMFDVNKTSHSFERSVSGRTDIEGYSDRPVANREINELIMLAKDKIAEKIVNHEIVDNQDFVIKSLKWELALGIVAVQVEKTYWKLIIKTVFRESPEHKLLVGKDEVVFWV